MYPWVDTTNAVFATGARGTSGNTLALSIGKHLHLSWFCDTCQTPTHLWALCPPVGFGQNHLEDSQAQRHRSRWQLERHLSLGWGEGLQGMDSALSWVHRTDPLTTPKTDELGAGLVIWEKGSVFMSMLHFHNSLCGILTSTYKRTVTEDPKWQASLCTHGPLEKNHWFPIPRCLSPGHRQDTRRLAPEVSEVSGKAIAFDSSAQKASDFQFCLFSLPASNHHVHRWAPAPTSLHTSHWQILLAF